MALADNYVWNVDVKLSPNAVELILAALRQYHPEPAEGGLRDVLEAQFIILSEDHSTV